MSDEKKIVRLVPAAELAKAQQEEVMRDDQKELIAYLEEMLDRARAGDVTGMVAVFDTKGNGFFKVSTSSMLDNISQTIGELEIVKGEFVQMASDMAAEQEVED